MEMTNDIIKAMSAALAPVFLISAVGILVGAMNVRYGRVIDRTRHVLEMARRKPADVPVADIDRELRTLYGRARVLRTTVILSVVSIFSLSLCIFLIFSNFLWELSLPYVVPTLFSVGLIFLLASLACFIEDFATSLSALKREIRVAVGRDVV